MKNNYSKNMRLFHNRQRLYMNSEEREAFIKASKQLPKREHRLFCEVLHWTGARLMEGAALTGSSVDFEEKGIWFRTLKKGEFTKSGELKDPEYRLVPVKDDLLDSLDLFYDLRMRVKRKDSTLDNPLWPSQKNEKECMSRTTAWRIIKRALEIAGLEGKQCSPKGFRHGYGVAMIAGGMDIYELKKRMGHTDASTTSIYTQVVGQDAQRLAEKAWEIANKDWR